MLISYVLTRRTARIGTSRGLEFFLEPDWNFKGIGIQRLDGEVTPKVGMVVRKVGPTTGFTRGTITATRREDFTV